MNFLFAWRYFKSKKSTNAINIIAWISVTAITVGTAALIIVLSVFNGFEDLVKSLYADFYADIRVAPASGKTMLLNEGRIKQLQSIQGVAALSLIAEEKAVLTNGENQSIVFLKGVDAAYTHTNKITQHIIRGNFDVGTADQPKLIVGAGIENAVGIDIDKSLYPTTLYVPNRNASNLASLDALNAYSLKASGTFMVQQDFDNKYVFSNLGFVKYMLNMLPNEYSSVEIKTVNAGQADEVKKRINHLLGPHFIVETRYEQNKSLFTVMNVERWVIYVILSLILVVAAFNMIGALTMLILEKQKDIAVLKALGADNGFIQKIFVSEGFVLAGIGGIAGIALASLVCWLQLKFKFIKLAGGTFIIDYYPVQLHVADFILVTSTVLIIAAFASWIPARKAGLQHVVLKS
ncbi:MAG: ABC transporter permease [Bacteroidota bacterium]|nr:ABC transporter permease [Bacteroidota bacterium]